MRSRPLTHVVITVVVATLATALATIIYVAVDIGEVSMGGLIFAPMWQTVVVAIPVGLVLGQARSRLRDAPFVAIATIGVGLLAIGFGEVVLGHSPHYSRERAVVFLAAAWSLAAFVCSFLVTLAPKKSLERTRER